MWMRWWVVVAGLLAVILPPSIATLSPAGINYEVVALMAIKMELEDPYNALANWDINSVDPCSWRMATCSSDGYVSALYRISQPELVREIVTRHRQPHQAAVCAIT